MKKFIFYFALLLLAAQTVAQPVSRSAVYNLWKNRNVPPAADITKTWASFHNLVDDGYPWVKTGNAATDSTTTFIGTTDTKPFIVKTGGTERIRTLSDGFTTFNSSVAKGTARFKNSSSAWVDVGSNGLASAYSAIWLGNNSTFGNNFAVIGNNTDVTIFNGPTDSSQVYLTHGNAAGELFLDGNRTNSTLPAMQYVPASRTRITAGSNAPTYLFYGGSPQWKTGAITVQYNFRMLAPTFAAVAASTMSDGFNLYAHIPVQGTNMTITRKWGIGTDGAISTTQSLVVGALRTPSYNLDIVGTSSISGSTNYGTSASSNIHSFYVGSNATASMSIQGLVGSTAQMAFYGGVTASSSNYFFTTDNQYSILNAPSTNVYLRTANADRLVANSTSVTISPPTYINNYLLGVTTNSLAFNFAANSSHIYAGENGANTPRIWMNSGANVPTSTNWTIGGGASDNSTQIGYSGGTGGIVLHPNASPVWTFDTNGSLWNGNGAANASCIMLLSSTTKGFAPPQMTTTQKNAIATPLEGIMVYDLTLHQMSYYNGTTWVNY